MITIARHSLVLLALAALLARGIVPSGFMPDASGSGALTLCPGQFGHHALASLAAESNALGHDTSQTALNCELVGFSMAAVLLPTAIVARSTPAGHTASKPHCSTLHLPATRSGAQPRAPPQTFDTKLVV